MEPFKPYLSFTRNDINSNENTEDDRTRTDMVLIDSDSNNSSLNIEPKTEKHDSFEFVEASSSQLPPQETKLNFVSSISPDEEDVIRNNHLGKRKKMGLSPTETIFLGYAQTIETFSPKRQAITKLKIAQIIAEQELQQIEETGVNHV